MNIKRIFATTMIVAVVIISAAAVNAQGNGRGGRGFGAGELVETYTGLTGQELRQAFEDGSTLAELIEANGENVDDFVAEARTELEAHLNEALEDGRIDEATVEERLTAFDENIEERLNTVPELEDRNRPGGMAFGSNELLQTYTGLTAEELREAFANGSTPAELIEANGQSVEDFIAEARTALEDNLNTLAEERLTAFDENIEEHLNTVPQPGNPDGRGGRPGNRGPRHGG